MKSTELARSADMYQQAQLFILSAEAYAPEELFIEKAKLYWSKGDQTASISVLDRGIEQLFSKWPIVEQRSARLKNVFAEAKILVATYNADAMNTNTLLNIKYFKEAMKVAGNSEKCYVFYAQYSEKVWAAMSQSEQLGTKGNELQQEIMTCYGKSMLYGSRYIYQSMPRFLSIWLELTARLETNDGYKRVATNMNKIVDRFAESLPPFVFFTAFSQLVSRICHPSPEVYQVLKSIIVKLIVTFPQQSMWMIMSVYKSSYASRVRRCTEVFSDKRLADPAMLKLINDFNLLAERLIELTNKPVGDALHMTIKEFYRPLPILLKTPGFSPIIMPTNKYMLPVLPSGSQRDRCGDTFNAFPNQAIYIQGCGNDLVVMPSLQKPKRMKLIGDDGCDYLIMMKPKDDLRKDFRLMEFNAIVNRYLRLNAETRQRRLYIRTYAVLPLNEECGILEWVDNLQTLRPIVAGNVSSVLYFCPIFGYRLYPYIAPYSIAPHYRSPQTQIHAHEHARAPRSVPHRHDASGQTCAAPRRAVGAPSARARRMVQGALHDRAQLVFGAQLLCAHHRRHIGGRLHPGTGRSARREHSVRHEQRRHGARGL